jgi:DNA-directed RNA polymerase specialized sigma24 family protein
MSSSGSVSIWITELRAGDPLAAQRLWENYFPRLAALARKKLQDLPRRMADEEDVALSAFDSFCRGAEQGRFPSVTDRDNLWGLLVTITARKAVLLVRHEFRQKRGGGEVHGDSAFQTGPAVREEEAGLEQIVGSEPTPEFAAQMAEEYQRLLARLGEGDLAQIAVWKMEGYSNEEIAARLGCVPRTVERKVALIRTIWQGRPSPT